MDTFYDEFKARFPTAMLEAISEKIYQYNRSENYDVISRNCQHFALDFIATLGLDCDFLNTQWLDTHIKEFVQHPECIMPSRMGSTAAEFIEFVLKPNNKQIIDKSILYVVSYLPPLCTYNI